jgi:hypothetical protein
MTILGNFESRQLLSDNFEPNEMNLPRVTKSKENDFNVTAYYKPIPNVVEPQALTVAI